MHSLNCLSFVLKQTNIKKKKKPLCDVWAFPVVPMALQMTGKCVAVLLVLLFCLDFQGHAQQFGVDVEVDGIFH